MIYFDNNYQMTYKLPKSESLAGTIKLSKEMNSEHSGSSPSTFPQTYESTLIKRNESENNESLKLPVRMSKLQSNNENYTLKDLLNRKK